MNTPTKHTIRDYAINLNSSEFKEAISNIMTLYPDIKDIIETGTFDGLGSTKVFAITGKDVFSIECNEGNFKTASNNLRYYDNVCVIHGLSVDREFLIRKLLEEDFTLDTSYDSKNPKTFYMREVVQSVVQEDCLRLFSDNDRRQLIFLDSAGGVGYIEFNYLMGFSKDNLENKILVLDDCNHIKHKRSIQFLYSLGYKVNMSSDYRFGWCDLSTMGFYNSEESIANVETWMNIKKNTKN